MNVIQMRQSCKRCGCETGTIERKANNDVVRCSSCRFFVYNKPRTEDAEIVGVTPTTKSLFGEEPTQ